MSAEESGVLRDAQHEASSLGGKTTGELCTLAAAIGKVRDYKHLSVEIKILYGHCLEKAGDEEKLLDQKTLLG